MKPGLVRRSRRLQDKFLPSSSPLRLLATPTTMAFAGGRAILMELAHPAIAQAVADFDHFREDPARRAQVTAMAFHDVVHGTDAEAAAVTRRLHRVHARVTGPTYAASDPELILWVHATFVDSLLAIGQRVHGALTSDEIDDYYRDALTVGEVFGCPPSIQPPTVEAFREYVSTVTESLEVSDVGRELARAVFWPDVPASRAPLVALYRIASFGTLPASLRAQFRCRWDRPHHGILTTGTRLAPLVAPLADQLFYAVADGDGRGVRATLALAGIRRSGR